MAVRISNWYQVLAYSAAMTAVSVIIPLAVVAVVYRASPLKDVVQTYELAGFIPLFLSPLASVFSFYMIMTLHETVSRVDQLLKYDAMTGLLARGHFLRLAEQDRSEGGFLVLADADWFKLINDTHGHGAGDAALKHLASMMLQVFGPYGYVGRMGGEEFAARLPRLNRAQTKLLLQAMGTRLRNEGFNAEGHYLTPTMSLGVVGVEMPVPVASQLRAADRALYVAKERGRDQFVFAEELDTMAIDAA